MTWWQVTTIIKITIIIVLTKNEKTERIVMNYSRLDRQQQ